MGPARVDYADVWGTRGDKYSWLNAHDVADTEWNQLTPARPFYLFTPYDVDLLPEYEAGWKIVDVFGVYGSGITSGRNGLFLGLTRAELLYRIEELRGGAASDASLSDRHRVPAEALPEIRAKLRAQPALAEQAVQVAYRPFDTRYLLYSPPVLERPRTETMRHMRPQNVALLTHRPQSPQEFTYAFCTRLMGDQCVAANKSTGGGNSYLLPLYRYPDGESADLFANGEREPNLSPAFIADLEGRLALEFIPDGTGDLEATVGPEDVFHYLYAALHSPTYRSRYAEFLKIDFPRVPLTRNRELFRALAAKGAELVALHLLEAPALSGALAAVPFPVAGPNEVEPGHPCYLPPGEPEPGTGEPLAAGRVYLGKEDPKTGKRGQYFDRVPPEVWEFHVGGYQVCEKWLKDRRGRALTLDDLTHYQKIVVALGETIRLMGEIDEVIEEQGGWPVE